MLKTEGICQTHYTVAFILILWCHTVAFLFYDALGVILISGSHCKWESKVVVYTYVQIHYLFV